MCESLEELYLLEFYVDVVKFYDNVFQKEVAISPDDLGETVIKFKYFGSNCVEIREEDFCPSTKPLKESKRKVPLKSGKSCLFSLKTLQHLPTGSFDVEVNVYRKILNPEAFQVADDDENWEDVSDHADADADLPVVKGKTEPKTEFLIGRTDVSLYESFKYLKGDLNSKESFVNAVKNRDGLKDSVDRSYKNGSAVVECQSYLRDEDTTVTGEIVFLVRTSCFGRTILTQFQLSEEEAKSYMYKRTDRGVCANSDGNGLMGNAMGDSNVRIVGENNAGKRGTNEKNEGEDVKKGVVAQEKQVVKQGERDVEGVKQVKQSKPKEKKKSKSPECPYGFVDMPNGDMDLKTLCECVCKCVMNSVQNNQMGSSTAMTQSKPDQDQIVPGSVGMVGNQMILRMPDKPDKLGVESKFTSSVYYTQNGEDVGEDIGQVVNVRPEYPHMAAKDDPHAKQDVLVLKLGRKRIAAGKKPRIEIEMRTPKFKDEKPESESKETQYLASDIPKPTKKPGSAKSGKSGKSGKKGKGGKKK